MFATLQVERRGLLDQAKKEKQGGWFSGWWSSSPKAESSDKVDISKLSVTWKMWRENVCLLEYIILKKLVCYVVKQFEEAMTPEEKQKLFRAIDYQENAAPAEYPVEFVAVDLNFVLHSLVVCLQFMVYSFYVYRGMYTYSLEVFLGQLIVIIIAFYPC